MRALLGNRHDRRSKAERMGEQQPLEPQSQPVLSAFPSSFSASPKRLQPRTVTPGFSASDSWENHGDGIFGSVDRRRGGTPSTPTRAVAIVQENDEEDMPMDEMMATRRTASINSMEVVAGRKPAVTPVTEEKRTLPSSRMSNDSLEKLILALQTNNEPEALSVQEHQLWEMLQSKSSKGDQDRLKSLQRELKTSSHREAQLEVLLSETKNQLLSMKKKQSDGENTATELAQLKNELRESTEKMQTKDTEHESSIRAIQRVMAEMTTEKESEAEKLKLTIEELKSNKGTPKRLSRVLPPASTKKLEARIKTLEKEKETAKKELEAHSSKVTKLETEKATTKKSLDAKAKRLAALERDHKVVKSKLKHSEASDLTRELEDMKNSNEKLKSELEAAKKIPKGTGTPPPPCSSRAMTPPRPERGTPSPIASSVSSDGTESVTSQISQEDVDNLQKSLVDTATSLENAKKIIASLESANGAMATDMRNKLKTKDDEIKRVESESAERKRHLDSLATELRDLQKQYGDTENTEKATKAFVLRHKALISRLQTYVVGLQSASVVHEVSTSTGEPDKGNVEQISDILTEAMHALRSTVEMTENFVAENDDIDSSIGGFGDGGDVSSEVGKRIDSLIRSDREATSQDLRTELEQKKSMIRKLEDVLNRQSDEMKRLRTGDGKRGSDDTQELKAEIQSLREQCSTNMEVLAKKERELSVLRSSLDVDENDAGYISDDASDEEDEGEASVISLTRLNGYDPAETEALATIMSVSGHSTNDHKLQFQLSDALKEKEKVAADLAGERRSLASAKMIISSLEKANKSMLEDLRSRLQDSNTAIASLLDKSMEHEKVSNSLREELDTVKKHKEEQELGHESQLKKYKDEAKVFSLRIASKDRELTEIRKRTSYDEKKEDDRRNSKVV